MNKLILLLALFFAVSENSFAQTSTGHILFVIDSIPVFYDLYPWENLWEEDIATKIVIKNDQHSKLKGTFDIDSITCFLQKRRLKGRTVLSNCPV